MSGVGGFLPDIDAISMWSRFDSLFGRLLGLEHTGRVIYSGKFWYSHHAFMHSLLAAFLIAVFIGLLFWLSGEKTRKQSPFRIMKDRRLLLGGFFLGFVIHLVQDMITPAGSWGGVCLFFPMKVYVGGTGTLWWWNNYNLFLVACGILTINMLLLLFLNRRKLKLWKYTTAVFLIGCICFAWQAKRINYNFNGKKYADCEQKSKEIQRDILGERAYRYMSMFDNAVIFSF